MRKTIYTICILIILVIAAFLVSPYFLGGQTQENFHKQIAAFNKSSPYITITPESYKRHWFSSDAQVKVNFHTPTMMGPDQFNRSFTYNAVIKHGPLFFLSKNGKSSMHWGAGAILIKGDTKDFDGVVAIELNWNNHPLFFADVPHLVLHDDKNNTYTISNLKVNTLTHGKNIKITLSIPKLSIKNDGQPPVQIVVKNIAGMGNGREVEGLLIGKLSCAVSDFSVGLDEHGALVSVADVKNISTDMENTLSKDKTKINSTLNFNIDSMSAMGNTIKPITLSYSINGVDFAAYQQLMQAAQQLQHQANSTPTAQQGIQLANAAIKVLESGFTIKVNKIYVGLPKTLASSPLSAKAQLDLKPTTNLTQQISSALVDSSKETQGQGHANAELEQQIVSSLPEMMSSLAKAVSANGDASIPESLVKQALLHIYTKELMREAAAGHNVSQTPQELSTQAYNYLTQNKMLIPNSDGSVKIAFTFKNGQLLVNGEEPAFNLPKPSTQPATSPATEKPASA